MKICQNLKMNHLFQRYVQRLTFLVLIFCFKDFLLNFNNEFEYLNDLNNARALFFILW